jgi:hypothetical protein
MSYTIRSIAATVVVVAGMLTGCSQMPSEQDGRKLNDGELTVPADYRGWPKFLSEVQRADNKQIRELYINRTGYYGAKKPGDVFPHGTLMVMEIYKAREAADGTPLKTMNGKFVKGDLVKIALMGKGEGWGDKTVPELKNGEWIYAMYMADGKTKAPDDTATCRACHLPLKDKDYVFRYDEYFSKR